MKVYPFLSSAISRVIESLRAERGMTKSSLADFACLERRYLRDIERELKKPTVNAIYSICEALRIKPEDFFKRVSEEIEKRKNGERRASSISKVDQSRLKVMKKRFELQDEVRPVDGVEPEGVDGTCRKARDYCKGQKR